LESIDGGPVTGSSTSTVETRYRINAGGWGQDSYETASVSYPLSDAEAETDASDPARSTESILEEYRDRAEQAERLKATIANPDTDPGMIDYFQDLLDDENNILDDLTTEALAAGIPQSELNQIDAEAAADPGGSGPTSAVTATVTMEIIDEIFVVNRNGNSPDDPEQLGHIDLVIPGRGVIGYYGYTDANAPRPGGVLRRFRNLVGILNSTADEWISGPAARPDYVTSHGNGFASDVSQIVSINVTADQLLKLQAAVDKINSSPGEFNILTNNCTSTADKILRSAGVLPANSVVQRVPKGLMDALIDLGGESFGGSTLVHPVDKDGDGKVTPGIVIYNEITRRFDVRAIFPNVMPVSGD